MHPHTTVQGNVTAAPRLKRLDDGRHVANFQIACNNEHFDRESRQWVQDPTTFVPCVAWGRFARVVATWTKGSGRWSRGRCAPSTGSKTTNAANGSL